jgi:Cu(I)/Ag(I) efflux system membrane protein CusA/SilA
MTMTGLSTCIGLAPIMLSTGAGADVMKRIAAPMIGGVVSALVTALIIFPAIYAIWRGYSIDAGSPASR